MYLMIDKLAKKRKKKRNAKKYNSTDVYKGVLQLRGCVWLSMK